MNNKFILHTLALLAASQVVAGANESSKQGKCGATPCAKPQPSCEMPSVKPQPSCETPCNVTFFQGEPLCGEYPPAYNAPASVAVSGRNYCSNWQSGYFADASFLYWFGGQEGMSVAFNGVISGVTDFFTTHTSTFNQSFNYKPGFRLGLGYVGDREWVLHAEYTWLRGSNTSHFSPSSSIQTAGTSALTGTPVLFVADWFLNGTVGGQAFAATGITSEWTYGLDIVDLTVSRPFYEGPCWTVAPIGGVRGAWIRQKMEVDLSESPAMFGGALPVGMPPQPIGSRNYSRCWSVGPTFGMDTYCLMPMGFRFEGDLSASLLYSRYKVRHSEDRASTAFNPGPYTASISNYGCLRPMADLSLGLGWGSYIYCNDFHVDLLASYEFTYMWNQNMMRKVLDDVLTGTGPSSSDLYFHGLTFSTRFDF